MCGVVICHVIENSGWERGTSVFAPCPTSVCHNYHHLSLLRNRSHLLFIFVRCATFHIFHQEKKIACYYYSHYHAMVLWKLFVLKQYRSFVCSCLMPFTNADCISLLDATSPTVQPRDTGFRDSQRWLLCFVHDHKCMSYPAYVGTCE